MTTSAEIRIPSYYSIIPATVRYDRTLTGDDKVLYSELTAMATVHGYAFVSNGYLAALYQVGIKTIQRSIKRLADQKHIYLVTEPEKGNERKIYLTVPPRVKTVPTPRVKTVLPGGGVVPLNTNKEILNKSLNPNDDITIKKQYNKNARPDITVDWLDDFIANIK